MYNDYSFDQLYKMEYDLQKEELLIMHKVLQDCDPCFQYFIKNGKITKCFFSNHALEQLIDRFVSIGNILLEEGLFPLPILE